MADPLGPSLFIEAFGIKSPILKVLDFFMDNEGFDYSKAEVMEGTDLSRTTLFNVWPRLEALDLLTATRNVGRAKMYRLNKQNPIVKKLIELDDAISEFCTQKQRKLEPGSTAAEILGPDQDPAGAIVECKNVPRSERKDEAKELLVAQ
jgi:hypothetical protein